MNATFSILINGATTNFFHASRGLRQGCPLSPLLFVLVMEGLSSLIHREKEAGDIHGIRLHDFLQLAHLLFVDDVIIFLDGSCQECSQFDKILHIFCRATGMAPNHNKSTIIQTKCLAHEHEHAIQKFPYVCNHIGEGLKYLGFHLKPNDYQIKDWNWLIAKVECRINIWHHRWLSRAGRLVLIKSVLEAIPVY